MKFGLPLKVRDVGLSGGLSVIRFRDRWQFIYKIMKTAINPVKTGIGGGSIELPRLGMRFQGSDIDPRNLIARRGRIPKK
ncbi:MAG: hypothetical protein K9N46_10185 [Candidatus Marinimicrobia bacterium]|nr:hypothetical protein [Candidatus Neomarinimicrobiota bacterium]MCF7829254.1 hypothetical protein [Candidatus Neomarinimicrobiota bacterium]MCF7881093.1 hypothetical protein [Candidatus Neomarinimicrobiota bacterium]